MIRSTQFCWSNSTKMSTSFAEITRGHMKKLFKNVQLLIHKPGYARAKNNNQVLPYYLQESNTDRWVPSSTK